MSVRPLPDRPHLDPLRSAAKRLLSGLRSGQAGSEARFARSHPAWPRVRSQVRLADAQLVIAREHGFTSWPELRRFVLYRQLVGLVQAQEEQEALELLAANPWLAGPPPVVEPNVLHWAAYKGCGALVLRLLRMGADPHANDPKFGSPAVGWANEGGHADIVDLIVAEGAEVDMSRAAAAGLLDRVRGLVGRGALSDEDLTDDWQPLAQAAGWGHLEVVAYLLEAGAPVNGRSEGGVTPLHAAVEWGGQLESARLLLEAGADPDAVDDRGRSPREAARELGDVPLMELLDGDRHL